MLVVVPAVEARAAVVARPRPTRERGALVAVYEAEEPLHQPLLA